jgi:hypothetical protein
MLYNAAFQKKIKNEFQLFRSEIRLQSSARKKSQLPQLSCRTSNHQARDVRNCGLRNVSDALQ